MIVAVKHNIEVAHRLYGTPGKCEAIHGHSMWITLRLVVAGVDASTGIALDNDLQPLEFGAIKKKFREYLDINYDHRLLLNKDDPWAGKFNLHDPVEDDPINDNFLPGLHSMPDDPSTENISCWIAKWAAGEFQLDVQVETWETSVNMASVNAFYNQGRVQVI